MEVEAKEEPLRSFSRDEAPVAHLEGLSQTITAAPTRRTARMRAREVTLARLQCNRGRAHLELPSPATRGCKDLRGHMSFKESRMSRRLRWNGRVSKPGTPVRSTDGCSRITLLQQTHFLRSTDEETHWAVWLPPPPKFCDRSR